MKAMYIILVSFCLLCIKVNASDFKSRVTGKWEVGITVLADAGLNFILDIREKDKAIIFDIQSVDEVDIKEMRFTEKNGKLSANLYIGEFVKLVIWEEKGVMKGSFQMSSFGELPLTLKKIEK